MTNKIFILRHLDSCFIFLKKLFRFKSSHFKRKAKAVGERVVSEALGAARSTTSTNSPLPLDSSADSTRKRIWERQRAIMERHNTSVTTTGSNLADGIVLIKEYNTLPMVDMSSDPLSYWKSRNEEGILPGLFPVVKKFLCVPATSVP